ncbi:hypothetical protein BDK51DRAFT_52236 [Blyttiomyces helicus]|uniref:F-box domain-containing protein n=1 Tax=Blyttiomyces helicus TaxID=388810 RepID=A0A4P9VYZ4_9FUNG|nr:hypothetical protein BDK51DRAFT_52236 [Blyttiomyces helicus]|eukprot:RKO83558.1 hypothetical protein BDK51DRAFT_52236 [Blyttiomyces helicus]
MRKHRIGDAYAARPPTKRLFISGDGLPTPSVRDLVFPLFANVVRLDINHPEPDLTSDIDMSLLGPLLIACKHLSSFSLASACMTDARPLSEGKWVAVESVIAGLTVFALEADVGAAALTRMRMAIVARGGDEDLLTLQAFAIPSTVRDLILLINLRGSRLERLHITGDGWHPEELFDVLGQHAPDLDTVAILPHDDLPVEISFRMLDTLKAHCKKLESVYPLPTSPGPLPQGVSDQGRGE